MTVGIVLATLNGGAFLAEQLRSIASQTTDDWVLIVTDDGSTDATPDIVARFSAQHPGKVHWVAGPQRGLAANFLHGLRQVPTMATHVAFSDQDDVWHPEKLAAALNQLNGIRGPALYCGTRTICDEHLTPTGRTTAPGYGCTFANALVQNVASGNATVLNRDAIDLLNASDPHGIVFHDWWSYQLITGAGGTVVFDPTPYIFYRQHKNNQVGAAQGFAAWINRFRRVQNRTFARVLEAHHDALDRNAALLTPVNRALSTRFRILRTSRLMPWHPLPVHRQTAFGQCALRISLFLGWGQTRGPADYGSRNASCDLYKGRIR